MNVIDPIPATRADWYRAWRDARRYRYVPTGLPLRGTALDYRAVEMLRTRDNENEPTLPNAVLRAQMSRRESPNFWFLLNASTVLTHVRSKTTYL